MSKDSAIRRARLGPARNAPAARTTRRIEGRKPGCVAQSRDQSDSAPSCVPHGGLANGIPAGYAQLKAPESGGEFVLEDIEGEMLTRRNCPEFGGDGEGRGKLARWSWGADRLESTGRALTGLTGFFDGITWACARRTRSNPGYHIGGLQPQKRGCVMRPPHIMQDAGGELLMRRECPEFPNPTTGFTFGDCHRRRPAAEVGVSAKPAGCFRPGRAEVLFFLRLPWVTRGATHGYSHGIPQGCARLRPAPILSRKRDGERRGPRNPGISRMGYAIEVTRCSG